jgi:hypothetical protein
MKDKITAVVLAAIIMCVSAAACKKVTQTANPPVSADTAEQTNSETSGSTETTAPAKVSAETIFNAIKSAYGDKFMANVPMISEDYENVFGLTPDMYTEITGGMPAVTIHVDRVLVVKAADGKLKDIETALTAAKENFVKDTLQYPVNIAKVNAAKIVTKGNYAAFIMAGDVDERTDVTDEDKATFAEEQVQRGVDAFNAAVPD